MISEAHEIYLWCAAVVWGLNKWCAARGVLLGCGKKLWCAARGVLHV